MHPFFRTRPGQALIAGLVIKVVLLAVRAVGGGASTFVGTIDTMASIAIAVGGTIFLVGELATIRRRLLWRVRRKLIISYIFIGFVPAILLVAFSLLGGLLLFSNFSSYLVQTRLKSMVDRAESVAVTTAREIQRAGTGNAAAVLEQRQAAVDPEFPGASLAVVPLGRPCARTEGPADRSGEVRPARAPVAGPWTHLDAPETTPGWIACDGFSGFVAYDGGDGHIYLVLRAVEFPQSSSPTYAVVVDLPITAHVKAQLQLETGVELSDVRRLPDGQAALLAGRPLPPAATTGSSLLLSSFSVIEFRDWTSGEPGTLAATIRLSITEIYARLSAGQSLTGNASVGQVLLVILVIIGVLFLVIQAAALVAGLALARSITGSVHELFEGTERVRKGDFTHKIAITARDQLGELAESFNLMTASIEDLLLQAAEKKRLEEELRIAHEIQMSLLPQGPLDVPGLSLTAICVPAREVGGDYYDFLRIDDRRLGVLIADVSGKGTSAALYMAELKGVMLSLSRTHTSPRALLIEANRIIAEHLDARSFITMTYAVIDLQARTMTYARAGHTPLMALPRLAEGQLPSSRQVQVLTPDGMVLGLKLDDGRMFDRLLEEQTLAIAEGDLYVFFTDGISEAMNTRDDCFGEQRLARLVEQHADLPSEELRERVLREIEAFVGDAPQHDDMTMILLRVEALAAEAPAPAPTVAAMASVTPVAPVVNIAAGVRS
jgi:phosphoserine phosphatase RsbU/P